MVTEAPIARTSIPIILLLALILLAACGERAPVAEPAVTDSVLQVEPMRAPDNEPATESAPETATEAAEPQISGTRAPDAPVERRAFELDPAHSEARFLIDEVLLGEDKTVVGVTSQISGTLHIDPANPRAAEIDIITIDARDLTTDSSRRNRAIQRQILRSAADENRYITFTPTAIDELPETVAIGEPFTFSVTGDLYVRGESRQETFTVSVTPLSPDELTGLAAAVIRYADYGITIPSVPAVASVADEVRLELEFTARAGE